MSVITRFYLVRHGETDENRLGIMQGHMDTKLNEEGIKQAHMAAAALEKIPFKEAYSSDLSRAVKTAEIILSKHPAVGLKTCQELRERYLGDLEGFKLSERSKMPENRETSDTFSARAVQWWNRVVQRQESLHKNSQEFEDERTQPVNILITTHGGLIVTLTQNLLGSRKIRCEDGVKVGKCLNASISIIEMEKGGKGVLVKYSDAAHLDANVVEVNVDVIGVSSS